MLETSCVLLGKAEGGQVVEVVAAKAVLEADV